MPKVILAKFLSQKIYSKSFFALDYFFSWKEICKSSFWRAESDIQLIQIIKQICLIISESEISNQAFVSVLHKSFLI